MSAVLPKNYDASSFLKQKGVKTNNLDEISSNSSKADPSTYKKPGYYELIFWWLLVIHAFLVTLGAFMFVTGLSDIFAINTGIHIYLVYLGTIITGLIYTSIMMDSYHVTMIWIEDYRIVSFIVRMIYLIFTIAIVIYQYYIIKVNPIESTNNYTIFK